MVDLDLFDKWLYERRYIRRKGERKKIISLYKRLLKQEKNINDLTKEYDKLGYPEETINDITTYLTFWNYRKKENEKCKEAMIK